MVEVQKEDIRYSRELTFEFFSENLGMGDWGGGRKGFLGRVRN